MSQKEMDQMDQECEAVVNGSAAPEAMAAAEAIAEEWHEEQESKCKTESAPNPCREPMQREGAQALIKDLKKEAKKRLRRQLAVRIVLCLLAGIFFVAALVEPKLITWLANAGVMCCGIVMAVGIDRHCRRF